MNSAGYPVYDADNHMYETRDALLRYLPASAPEQCGTSKSMAARKKSCSRTTSATLIPPNPTHARVARPGSAKEWFHGRNPGGKKPSASSSARRWTSYLPIRSTKRDSS